MPNTHQGRQAPYSIPQSPQEQCRKGGAEGLREEKRRKGREKERKGREGIKRKMEEERKRRDGGKRK